MGEEFLYTYLSKTAEWPEIIGGLVLTPTAIRHDVLKKRVRRLFLGYEPTNTDLCEAEEFMKFYLDHISWVDLYNIIVKRVFNAQEVD